MALIDFDWCGEVGVTRRRAPEVNKEQDGVVANGVIKRNNIYCHFR